MFHIAGGIILAVLFFAVLPLLLDIAGAVLLILVVVIPLGIVASALGAALGPVVFWVILAGFGGGFIWATLAKKRKRDAAAAARAQQREIRMRLLAEQAADYAKRKADRAAAEAARVPDPEVTLNAMRRWRHPAW
jgi:hypothetical protein